MKFTQARIILKERAAAEKIPPEDWVVGKTVGHFASRRNQFFRLALSTDTQAPLSFTKTSEIVTNERNCSLRSLPRERATTNGRGVTFK